MYFSTLMSENNFRLYDWFIYGLIRLTQTFSATKIQYICCVRFAIFENGSKNVESVLSAFKKSIHSRGFQIHSRRF